MEREREKNSYYILLDLSSMWRERGRQRDLLLDLLDLFSMLLGVQCTVYCDLWDGV